MKIAAIVCEYNPFHSGHKYQLDAARRLLGEDTLIVSVMSGNFTQRAELAFCDKLIRAKAAVECGVNLVLELPFPYSSASAEFFAKGAIHIINSLGVVDYLVFGAECESLEKLSEIAKRTSTPEFKEYIEFLSKSDEKDEIGYPKLCEIAYRELYSDGSIKDIFSPNNILAIEYLKALIEEKSEIEPVLIKREGAGYSDGFAKEKAFQSASALREIFKEDLISAKKYIPESAFNVFLDAYKEGKLPADEERLSSAVLSNLRLNPPEYRLDIFDARGGLYNRLYNKSFKATSIKSLMKMTETKKYTNARLRRAMWNSFFGVTSSELRTYPKFTQILALDSFGRSILKRIPKTEHFHIFTKPTKKDALSKDILYQKERSERADSVYGLSLCVPNDGSFYLTMTPYVKL